jgi:hypothetical protein
MDPATALGVAAAATQFAEQAVMIFDCLYQYSKSVKNAPAKSRELRQELLLLSDLLENLASVFSKQNKSPVLPNASKYSDLLQDLKETMTEMAEKAEITAGKISLKRLVWPFKQKDNEKYLAKVERFKTLFHLALQRLESYVFLKVKPTFRAKVDNIEYLARRIDYIVEHMNLLNLGACLGDFADGTRCRRAAETKCSRFTLTSNSRKAITCLELDLP